MDSINQLVRPDTISSDIEILIQKLQARNTTFAEKSFLVTASLSSLCGDSSETDLLLERVLGYVFCKPRINSEKLVMELKFDEVLQSIIDLIVNHVSASTDTGSTLLKHLEVVYLAYHMNHLYYMLNGYQQDSGFIFDATKSWITQDGICVASCWQTMRKGINKDIGGQTMRQACTSDEIGSWYIHKVLSAFYEKLRSKKPVLISLRGFFNPKTNVPVSVKATDPAYPAYILSQLVIGRVLNLHRTNTVKTRTKITPGEEHRSQGDGDLCSLGDVDDEEGADDTSRKEEGHGTNGVKAPAEGTVAEVEQPPDEDFTPEWGSPPSTVSLLVGEFVSWDRNSTKKVTLEWDGAIGTYGVYVCKYLPVKIYADIRIVLGETKQLKDLLASANKNNTRILKWVTGLPDDEANPRGRYFRLGGNTYGPNGCPAYCTKGYANILHQKSMALVNAFGLALEQKTGKGFCWRDWMIMTTVGNPSHQFSHIDNLEAYEKADQDAYVLIVPLGTSCGMIRLDKLTSGALDYVRRHPSGGNDAFLIDYTKHRNCAVQEYQFLAIPQGCALIMSWKEFHGGHYGKVNVDGVRLFAVFSTVKWDDNYSFKNPQAYLEAPTVSPAEAFDSIRLRLAEAQITRKAYHDACNACAARPEVSEGEEEEDASVVVEEEKDASEVVEEEEDDSELVVEKVVPPSSDEEVQDSEDEESSDVEEEGFSPQKLTNSDPSRSEKAKVVPKAVPKAVDDDRRGSRGHYYPAYSTRGQKNARREERVARSVEREIIRNELKKSAVKRKRMSKETYNKTMIRTRDLLRRRTQGLIQSQQTLAEAKALLRPSESQSDSDSVHELPQSTKFAPKATLEPRPTNGPPPGCDSREGTNVAASFLEEVKRELGERSNVYKEFLDIFSSYGKKQVDTQGLIEKVTKLLEGYNHLILRFNRLAQDDEYVEPENKIQQEATLEPGSDSDDVSGPPVKRSKRRKLGPYSGSSRTTRSKSRGARSPFFRPLTQEQTSRVNEALYNEGAGNEINEIIASSTTPDEIIASSESDTVQRQSIQTLQPYQWLNDEVIHYFYLMLARRDEQMCAKDPSRKRSHFFRSFFFTRLLNEGHRNEDLHGIYCYENVKRWSKKVPGKDIFNLDKIIFPINQGQQHWMCAAIHMQKKRIQFYDSMGSDGTQYLNLLFQYIQDEHKDKKKCPLPDIEEWNLVKTTADTPRQRNGFDCGVFTCMFADLISLDKPLNFTQEDIEFCRQRIAFSILNGAAIE